MHVKGGRATWAIVAVRLRRDAFAVVTAAASCAILAYLQRFEPVDAKLAGALTFGTLTGICLALLARSGSRLRQLELCELTAPLYGRELARATALVPCIAVSVAGAAYWIVASMYTPFPAPQAVVAICGSCAAALVAMCASVRAGLLRAAYVAMACGIALAAFIAIMRNADVAALLCAACGFIALRQYGEALARYNPL